MIVGSRFEGDVDEEIWRRQHDVYREAVSAIREVSNRITRNAAALLGCEAKSGWGNFDSCDHRTLQDAHDILAAVWRFRFDLRQGVLKLENEKKTFLPLPTTPEGLWLLWLRDELSSWVWEPTLVRSVQIILAHQNKPVGYVAEAKLCRDLIDRFEDVPWRDSPWERFDDALSINLDRLPDGASTFAAVANAFVSAPCECTAQGRTACNMIPCKTLAESALREGWGPLD